MKKGKRKPKKKKVKTELYILPLVAIALTLIFLFYVLSIESQIITPEEEGTQPSIPSKPWNCGDLQIDIHSVREANSYSRFGILTPSLEDYKFVILNLTATNKGNEIKEYVGYRLDLIDGDGRSYKSITFSKVESIIFNNVTSDYYCEESVLASVSRPKLSPGQSIVGCKMFQILKTSQPDSLLVYDLVGLKCTIKV